MAIYELFGSNGATMQRIDTPENADKNRLPVGTILHLNGYSDPDYVIVKNLGISEGFSGYGANYQTVNLKDKTFSRHQAYCLKYLSEQRDGRIQTYITDRKLSHDETMDLYNAAAANQKRAQEHKESAEAEAKRLEAIGRDLFKKHIPETAKALIIASQDIDDCDMMTDYFNTKTGDSVILGWSKHTRDLFPEMRKAAGRIKETEHLARVPEVGQNGEARTEENKSWWHPEDEHREKYSMGAGNYLKKGNRYSSGWKVSKQCKWGEDWDRGVYISMALKCVFK